jgi:hypothetical protein
MEAISRVGINENNIETAASVNATAFTYVDYEHGARLPIQ